MIYDVYLFKVVENFDIVRNVLEAQGLRTQEIMSRLGYLGLNLDFLWVTSIMFLLREQGITGIEVPIKYRDATTKISTEEATIIADPYLRQDSGNHYPGYEFSPPILAGEQPMWYIFTTTSERLMQETKSPWRFHTYVDVLDGHVWTKEAREQFFEPFEMRMARLLSGQDKP
jgi:hypothetical protein